MLKDSPAFEQFLPPRYSQAYLGYSLSDDLQVALNAFVGETSRRVRLRSPNYAKLPCVRSSTGLQHEPVLMRRLSDFRRQLSAIDTQQIALGSQVELVAHGAGQSEHLSLHFVLDPTSFYDLLGYDRQLGALALSRISSSSRLCVEAIAQLSATNVVDEVSVCDAWQSLREGMGANALSRSSWVPKTTGMYIQGVTLYDVPFPQNRPHLQTAQAR